MVAYTCEYFDLCKIQGLLFGYLITFQREVPGLGGRVDEVVKSHKLIFALLCKHSAFK